MQTARNQQGVIPIIAVVLVVAALLGAGSYFGIKQYLKTHKQLITQDRQYEGVLGDLDALKLKAQDAKNKGASVSAFLDSLPSILKKIADNDLTGAKVDIASFSAYIDSSLANKLELDRLAAEAKKKADEEAKKKAAEDAAKKALAAQTPKPSTPAAPVTQGAPGSGYARIAVNTERGPFTIDVTTADVGSTRVITDAVSTGNCDGGCGAKPLSDYISSLGGYAGMNGTYFCPPDYANCAGKPYTFSWFVFNFTAKTFINADKRNYDNAGGLFVFRPGSITFYRNSQGWGLDTSVTGAIASWPAVLVNGVPQDDPFQDDKQRTLKGTRTGMCARGSIIRLVIARNATVNDLGYIFKALDCDNGINMDGGGSAAMWYGGYKVGPGRQLPNAVILAR